METVLTTPDLQDLVFTHMCYNDLSRVRCVSKGLQEAVSINVSKRVTDFHNRFQTRLNARASRSAKESAKEEDAKEEATIYESSYSALYNYYHTIIKLDMMVLPIDKTINALHFAESLRHIQTDVEWSSYERMITWNDDRPFYRLNRIHKKKQSLYDVMCHRYLGGDCIELTDDIRYLQNKLLPIA